jgi:hypothetical protein
MEYMINNFNLADIDFGNPNAMADYFNNSVIAQRVREILLGPNLLFLNYPKGEAKINREADQKILNTLCRLIYYNLSLLSENPQFCVIQTGSNLAAKKFIKKILKELFALISEKVQMNNPDMLFNSLNALEIMSFFTCMKDNLNEEVAICDYYVEFIYEDGILKYHKLDIVNFNEEVVINRTCRFNNLNIFYMLFYNLPVDLLKKYLLCKRTESYFNVFTKLPDIEDYVKRYLFISQFVFLRNEKQWEELYNYDSNQNVIKKEYLYYKDMYEKYVLISKSLKLDEKKLFDSIFATVLISELNNDDFTGMEILKKVSALLAINEGDLKLIYKDVAFGSGSLINLVFKKVILLLAEYVNRDRFVSKSKPISKFNILISGSNRMYNGCCSTDHSASDVKRLIVNNYIREIKSLIYFKNSLVISTQGYPKISQNEEYITHTASQDLISIMESLVGLLDGDMGKLHELREKVKQLRSQEIKIEGDVLRVKHSFGEFKYNLNDLLKQGESPELLHKYYKIFDLPTDRLGITELVKHETRYLRILESEKVTIYNTFIFNVLRDIDEIEEIIRDYRLNEIYYLYHNMYSFTVSVKELRDTFAKGRKLAILPKDDVVFFNNNIALKIRISKDAYYYDNGYIVARRQFSRVLDNNSNIASLIYKYNCKMFSYLVSKKLNHNKFSKLKFAINCVRVFLKLTKVYIEKKVFKQIRELLMEIVTKHYPDDIREIDGFNKFTFDFQNDILAKNLPKLHSNLSQLKKLWRNYITDIVYLETNRSKFAYPIVTERIIEDRLDNFRTLLFLFSKSYKFVNIEALKSVLHLEFTKTISIDILSMMEKYYIEMKSFYEERSLPSQDVSFAKLIIRRDSMEQLKKAGVNSIGSNKGRRMTVECKLLPDSRYSKSVDPVLDEPKKVINLKSLLSSIKCEKLITHESVGNDDEQFFGRSINDMSQTPNFKAEAGRSSGELRYSDLAERVRDFSIVNETSLNISPNSSFRQSRKNFDDNVKKVKPYPQL